MRLVLQGKVDTPVSMSRFVRPLRSHIPGRLAGFQAGAVLLERLTIRDSDLLASDGRRRRRSGPTPSGSAKLLGRSSVRFRTVRRGNIRPRGGPVDQASWYNTYREACGSYCSLQGFRARSCFPGCCGPPGSLTARVFASHVRQGHGVCFRPECVDRKGLHTGSVVF